MNRRKLWDLFWFYSLVAMLLGWGGLLVYWAVGWFS